jgi:pteridine reductase
MTKVALITGAARRIGASIAEALHQAGYRVLIHAHTSEQEANALCNKLNALRPNSAYVHLADLCDPATPETLISSVIHWGGRLDCLIHNASAFVQTDEKLPSKDTWQHLFSLNVEAPFYLSHAAWPHLNETQGSIIYLTDIYAHAPLKGYSIYCQTKAALNMQMLALAKAFAPDIRVNAVAPGAIAWPEGSNALSKKTQDHIISSTPLQKHGRPAYIAQAILALIENPFITGQVLKVDGGRSLNL